MAEARVLGTLRWSECGLSGFGFSACEWRPPKACESCAPKKKKDLPQIPAQARRVKKESVWGNVVAAECPRESSGDPLVDAVTEPR